jgi:hypothetical protein
MNFFFFFFFYLNFSVKTSKKNLNLIRENAHIYIFIKQKLIICFINTNEISLNRKPARNSFQNITQKNKNHYKWHSINVRALSILSNKKINYIFFATATLRFISIMKFQS